MAAVERLQHEAAAFGNEHLFMSRGNSAKLSNGYIPLLVNYTYEYKAAKGLRKWEAGQSREVPIYFTALVVLQDHKITLFSDISGSGKTTFARPRFLGKSSFRNLEKARQSCQRSGLPEIRIQYIISSSIFQGTPANSGSPSPLHSSLGYSRTTF